MLATRTTTYVLSTGNETETVAYDDYGNLISQTNRLGQKITYSGHDKLGNPATVTDANLINHVYAYNLNTTLKSVTDKLPMGDRVTSYTYNGDRQLRMENPHIRSVRRSASDNIKRFMAATPAASSSKLTQSLARLFSIQRAIVAGASIVVDWVDLFACEHGNDVEVLDRV